MDNDDVKLDIAVKMDGMHTDAFGDENDLDAAVLEIWCNLFTCYQA